VTAAAARGLEADEVARLLEEFGRRLELEGENTYRARAYYRAAASLRTLTLPLGDVIAAGRLREIPGVGPALESRIVALHESGTHPKLEAMRRDAPEGVLAMLRIPRLSADKVAKIHRELGIDSLEALEAACRRGDLAGVKGLGPALQETILRGIDVLRRSHGLRLIHHAGDILDAAAANLARSHPELTRIVPAGEYRRGCELVGDLAIVAETAPGDVSGTLKLGELTLHMAEPARYGPALVMATGSAAHVEALRVRAGERGLKLDASGLRRGRKLVPCPEESDVYAALGLPLIPPELRESGEEVALAAEGRLPTLVEDTDLRGLVHCHTDFSDGGDTLETMALATRKRGYRYFGVTDHSKSAGYAGGLSVEEVAEQHALADAFNARTRGFRIFKGIESDILVDGSLDYPDEVLARFDFVVASVHSRFRLDPEAQTARIIRAVANPYTTILGHMTGRMLMRREGYEVDIPAILAACAQHGVAVEINANPHRLDVDWRWHRLALDLGCTMSINPDAHATHELDLTHWGVLMARKGGVPKDRVLNCLDLKAFAAHVEGRKRAASDPGRG
jgi:DNA polymerase (family 10)